MDIKGLKYFIAAAERLNFTAAAKECYITQTAMSLHISKMEDELGFTLFNRNKRIVELTKAGENFLKHARALVMDYDSAIDQSANIAKGARGIINISLPSAIEGYVFIDKFLAFRKKYPEIKLNVRISPPHKLIWDLKAGYSDVGFGSPEDMELEDEFVVNVVTKDPVVLVCNKSNPLACCEKVTPDMLDNETVFLSEMNRIPGPYKLLKSTFGRQGVEPHTFHTINNLDEMLLMIDLEQGVGFLPAYARSVIEPSNPRLAFKECVYEGSAMMFSTALCYLKENTNPVLQNFVTTFI